MSFPATSRPSISTSPARRSPSQSARAGIQRKRILIVEDDLLLSEMFGTEINASEMVLVGAASHEALKLAASESCRLK
jgi:hypothetical protein